MIIRQQMIQSKLASPYSEYDEKSNDESKTIKENTHKTVAFGSTGILISDNDGLKNLAELLEVSPHGIALSLPGESSDEDLGVCGVPKRRIQKLVISGARTRP